jgi:glucose-fructose oxidoreductase
VECAAGWYELRPLQEYTGITGTTSDGQVFDTVIPHQQALQMDNDALAIMQGTPMMVPGEEGQRDVRIVEAILQCAETQQPVLI